MEDKTFNLLEKIYNEMQNGFDKVNNKIDNLENRIGNMESRIDNIENRMTKIEVNQEHFSDKLDEAYEALTTHIEISEKQHNEIIDELRGEINVVELAVKRVAK